MNYKILKQLKEAGFPKGENQTYVCKFNNITREEDCCYMPSLKQLIKSCGGDIKKIMQVRDSRDGSNKWYINGRQKGKSIPRIENWDLSDGVALLWLELNKKP